MDDTNVAMASIRAGPANLGAFWLSAIGLLFQGAAAAVVIGMYPFSQSFSTVYGGMMDYYLMSNDYYMMGAYNAVGWYWLPAVVVALGVFALGILGVLRMRSSSVAKVRVGGVLVLVAALAAFPLMWGFWVGSVLMAVGALMGMATAQSGP